MKRLIRRVKRALWTVRGLRWIRTGIQSAKIDDRAMMQGMGFPMLDHFAHRMWERHPDDNILWLAAYNRTTGRFIPDEHLSGHATDVTDPKTAPLHQIPPTEA